ncbi:helix-turn-helix domain-containing protein, partial [Klebsiella pneumoniae]|nr:helix-turn-helix domain-containing protein [Klebsiella pneumoniae]
RSRNANKECSVARAMEAVGDRWSILLLREAYYGVKRFDEFQYYIGIAPNILSTRLKKLVDAGIMTRVPLPEHAGR